MQIIKNKMAIRCPFGFCLLIALTFCLVGCDSPNRETEAPKRSGDEVVDMDIKSADSSTKKSPDRAEPKSQKRPASSATSPASPDKNMVDEPDSKTKKDSDDGAGPSLNAPKSTSTRNTPGQGEPSVAASAKTATGAVAGSAGDASLAIRFPFMERGI